MYARDYIQTHFSNAKLRSNQDYWDASCLLHEDGKPSLSIDAETGWCDCKSHRCQFAGWLDKYAERAGLPEPPPKDGYEKRERSQTASKSRDSAPKEKRQRSLVVAEYIYRNATGNNHMRVARTAAKDFYQARWDGLKWVNGLKTPDGPLPRIPYNLDKLAAAPLDQLIHWVEGEKDANKLMSLGLLATTSPGGAKSAGKLDTWEVFRGRRIVILADNDAAGRRYSENVAAFLVEAAEVRDVKICDLPGLPPKGDVSDWLATGRTVEDLKAAIAEHAEDFIKPTPKPDIQVCSRDVRDVADEVLSHLLNGDVYNRGGELVILERRNGQTPPKLVPLDKEGLLAWLPRHMSFHQWLKNGPKACAPPGWLAGLILDSKNTFPRARRVTELPYINASGRLVTEEGLDEESETILLPLYPGLKLPTNATPEDAKEAGKWLGEHLFGDFPFVKEYHRTHCVLSALQPFITPLIDGQWPLASVTATTEGTGKSRLCRTMAWVSDAGGARVVTESPNPSHFENTLGSVLRGGPTAVLLDNVKSSLDHVFLQGLLSTPEMDYRPLGGSVMVTVRNPHLWIVSANNPTWDKETRRRTIPIELDALCEAPWRRKKDDFKIANIEGYARQHRPVILEKIYTILLCWLNQGRPLSDHFLGSFEEWSQIMGGIAEVAGLPGFLQHLEDESSDMDHEALEWRALLKHWRIRKGAEWMYPGQVVQMCNPGGGGDDCFLVEHLADKGPGARSTLMGKLLTRNLRRVFGELRLIRKKGAKGWQYSVEEVDRGTEGGHDPEPPRPSPTPPEGGGVSPSRPGRPETDLIPSIRSAPQTPVESGVAASCRPCRPETPHHAHARTGARAEQPSIQVAEVGRSASKEEKEEENPGILAAELTKLQRQLIFLALKLRRLAYRGRHIKSEFSGGSSNPKWHGKEARGFIESGLWIPPTDLPWDTTLAIGPPAGWIFDGDLAAPQVTAERVAPARASPPEDEQSLGDSLTAFFH